MRVRNLLYGLAILFATSAISADNESAASTASKEQPPPHATCLSQCAANEQRSGGRTAGPHQLSEGRRERRP